MKEYHKKECRNSRVISDINEIKSHYCLNLGKSQGSKLLTFISKL